MEKPITNLMDWSAAVRSRDGFRCVQCGSTRLVCAHHIKPRFKRPDLIFDLNNGEALCRRCHHEAHILECAPNPELFLRGWQREDYIGKIGKLGMFMLGGMKIPVIIADVRCIYSRLDLLMRPIGGSGERWSKADYVELLG